MTISQDLGHSVLCGLLDHAIEKLQVPSFHTIIIQVITVFRLYHVPLEVKFLRWCVALIPANYDENMCFLSVLLYDYCCLG